MTDEANPKPAGTVYLMHGDGHSTVSGSVRCCVNPGCEQRHTPRATCKGCGWETESWPPKRPA